ncbi:MAG: hypothetical protein ACP6KW_05200 [Candidatus Thorarchaeota archaeon]
MSMIQGTVFYHLVLLIGMAFIGVYFWIILTAQIANQLIHLIFILTGFIATVSTMGLAKAHSRSGRLGLTMLSGLVGGVHGHLDITLYPMDTWGFMGTILFFWWLLGLMLAFAALFWGTE